MLGGRRPRSRSTVVCVECSTPDVLWSGLGERRGRAVGSVDVLLICDGGVEGHDGDRAIAQRARLSAPVIRCSGSRRRLGPGRHFGFSMV